MNGQKLKRITKRIGKILLWIAGGVIGLILLILILLTIPSVQTYIAQKAANYLSTQMQTHVSIDKLRIDFRLNIRFENLRLDDQHGNNLISAKKGRAGFPSLKMTKTKTNIVIKPVIVEDADVTLRRYAGDSTLNIQFFVDFVKPKKKSKKKTIVDLQQLQLINSRFQCRMDDTRTEDEAGVWNYRDIRLNEINLKVNQLLIIGDSLTFQIDKASAREHSGFKLQDLQGQLIISRHGLYCLNTRLQTENKSDVLLDFRFEYSNYHDFSDFINLVHFNSEVHSGVFNLKDLGYFAGKLQGMKEMVNVSAKVRGALVDLKVKEIRLSLGQKTEFEGDVALTGLPNIEETFIDLSIKELKTNIFDLEHFQLPKKQKIPLPDVAKNLQWVKLRGHFIGLYDNFFSDMQLSTALGNGSCELMLNARAKPMTYDGKLEVQHLMLGNLLKQKDLGLVSAKGQIKGKGVVLKDMDFNFDGVVSAIEYKNHTVERILLAGNFLSKQFEGKITCDDKDFDMDFNGNIDFNKEKPIYNFDLDVRAINLSSFQLLRPDSNAIVSAKIKTDLSGNNLDSLQGNLAILSFAYTENNVKYTIPPIHLQIRQLVGINKQVKLNSEVLDIDVKGEFTYKAVAAALQKHVHLQLSKLVPAPTLPQSDIAQKVDISLQMKRDIPLLVHFFPTVAAPKGLKAKLSMNEANNLFSFEAETPKLDITLRNEDKIKEYSTDYLKINANQEAEILEIRANCEAFRFRKMDTLADMQNLTFRSSIHNNIIAFGATAKGNDKNKIESLKFEGTVGFEAKNELWTKFKRGIINWNSNVFTFDTANYFHITGNNVYIENFGLYSRDRQKSIHVKSTSPNKNESNLIFDFNNIDLAILDLILNPYQIALEGVATGNGKFIQTPEGLAIGATLQVKDLIFNETYMGFLEGNTVWLNSDKKLYLGANLYETPNKLNQLLLVKGHLDPANKYINIDGEINNLNVRVLEKYLKSFASKVEGYGTGFLKFAGKTNNPKLTGEIVLNKAVMGIDFLKTEYNIDNGKLLFVDTGFIFENVAIRDAYHGKGTINGMVTHHHLQDWGADLRIQAENMMGLNTTAKDNSLFYGKAFATGNVSIRGKVNSVIRINVDVASNDKTDFVLSLGGTTTEVENNFITFVSSKKENEAGSSVRKEEQKAKLAVNLRINATPDAIVRVLLDPSIGGSIEGRGNGILELSLDEHDKFSLFGKYTINSGDFNLAYLNVIARTFKLENGSTITWNGNAMDGIVNVRAVQTTRVNTDNLTNTENSSIPPFISVNNIIRLNGNLLKPDFSYTFNLIDADERTRSFIASNVDTSDRDAMIKQMVNVLFFGRFEPTGGTANAATMVNSTVSYSFSELMSSHINRALSTIAPNVNIHPVFNPGMDGINQYTVDAEWRINNQWSIRGNGGYIETNENTNQNTNRTATNQYLVDVWVEWRLKKIPLKAKAFNITNQQDLLINNAPFSQGIGFSYSKNFDRIFVRKKKKNEVPKTENQEE